MGRTENILVYKPLKMAYCVVPKVGCTFWIRIFRFLNHDTGGIAVRSPFEIDAGIAHEAGKRTMKMYRMEKAEDAAEIGNMTRFMFSRNPYSRLWSAYVDKFILPNLWSSTGRRIAKRRYNASHTSLECGHDVTFEEFLQFVTDEGLKSAASLDGHWRPIQFYCNPCIFNPHIVAKQETFLRDSRHILSHFHLSDLLQNFSHDAHMESEIKSIVKWNFSFKDREASRCVSNKLLAERIWTALQINGYLPLDTRWPDRKYQESDVSVSTFLTEALETRRHNPRTADAWRSTRSQIMVGAYALVSKPLLDKIVLLFQKDFQYFGYETTLDGYLD
ncbi:carbohydrate sulfotransferase 11-like isoform X2 [Gigantopelta aegis]|nr:carbohydrate sulfotransferase 11-like isoform X2 [Gigantopelta aegis]